MKTTQLTEKQVLEQCRMYIAAMRIADRFGCATIGIQYQQGLKDLVPASDLAEGLLNNVDRPPVCDPETGRELFAGEALPHFNEVDECAGLDALITYRLWRQLGFPPENTLHDVRWGRHVYRRRHRRFRVGARDLRRRPTRTSDRRLRRRAAANASRRCIPARAAERSRASANRVTLSGAACSSRRGSCTATREWREVVKLPDAETSERWRLTTPQWPVMHARLKGVTRDQMMARHKSNHIQVVYAPDAAKAKKAMYTKAAAMRELGLKVHFCGV